MPKIEASVTCVLKTNICLITAPLPEERIASYACVPKEFGFPVGDRYHRFLNWACLGT